MKCWKCGTEYNGDAVICPSCGASLTRQTPATETGRAMRMLYDRYGAEQVLTNSAYLVNGLGDLTDDSKKVRNQLKMAMDAGLGRLYLDQLQQGEADISFDGRVRTLLTEDAGLSDKAAGEIAGYFDEMIGWRGTKQKTTASKDYYGPEMERKKPNESFGKEIERKKPKADVNEKPKKRGGEIFQIALLCVVVIGGLALLIQQQLSRSKSQETAAQSAAESEAESAAASEPETTPTDAEAERAAREAQKAAEEEEEQKDLKARFEAMSDYRGDLVVDDFIMYSETDNKYKDMSFWGTAFGPMEGASLPRGLKAGDSKATAAELYGDPDRSFLVDEDSLLYKLHMFEQDEEGAAGILGAECWRYELKTETMTYSLGLLFDQTSGNLSEFYVQNEKNE